MTGKGFVRIESFARVRTTQPHRTKHRQGANGTVERTWTVSDMVGELVRRPENAPHVTDPRAPEILYGADPSEVASRAIEMAERGKDLRGRSVKVDAKILASMVASWPQPWESVGALREGLPRIRAWAERFVGFAEREFPGRVGCVVLHCDELRPNLHALLLPKLRPMQLADGREILHFNILPSDPLRAAARSAKSARRNGRHAAAAAGAALQTRYARDVGYLSGMTRGDGAAGPRVARSDALLRARVREETLALCTRIEELEKENRRLAQAAVIAAAAERQNRARFGPDGPSRDTKLADPVRLAALLRIPDGHVVHRIDADGIIHSGGPPARPGEALCLDVGQLERIETARGIAAALSAYRDALGQASRETGELVRERDAALTRAATLAVQLENERRSVGAATAAATKEINDLTTKLEASGEAQRGLVKERDEASTALAALDVERRAERDLREAAEASTTTALSERDVAVECAREAEERAATASTAAVAARAGAVKAEAEAESRLTALKVSERAREASETREGIFARQLADAFSEAKESSKTAAKEMASRIAAQQERDRALVEVKSLSQKLEALRSYVKRDEAARRGPVAAKEPRPLKPSTTAQASTVVTLCGRIMSQLHLIAHAGGQVRNALPLLHEYITTRSLLDDEPVQAVARGVSSEVHQQLQARPDATHAWARLEDATAEIERCAMLLRFVVGETVEVQPAEQRALTALADLRSAVAAQVTWLPPRHEGTACVSQRVRQALHLRYLQPSERLHDAELTGIAMGWSAGLGSALMETMEGAHREMTGHSR